MKKEIKKKKRRSTLFKASQKSTKNRGEKRVVNFLKTALRDTAQPSCRSLINVTEERENRVKYEGYLNRVERNEFPQNSLERHCSARSSFSDQCFHRKWTKYSVVCVMSRYEKTGFLHMRKQRRRSVVQ